MAEFNIESQLLPDVRRNRGEAYADIRIARFGLPDGVRLRKHTHMSSGGFDGACLGNACQWAEGGRTDIAGQILHASGVYLDDFALDHRDACTERLAQQVGVG